MNSGGFGGSPMWFFWVILILVVVFIYYQLPSASNAVKEKSALDIVKARYAKGEIDETAFKKMTENLKLTE